MSLVFKSKKKKGSKYYSLLFKCLLRLIAICLLNCSFISFGTCEPFHTRSRICKDILSENVNYVYHTTGSPEQNTIAEELDKLDNTFLQPVIALEGQECINLTAKYLCNYYFPSCGSQEGVHIPVSICSRECNFVQARCPHMWNFIDAFLSQYTNLEMITCTNITAKFSGISPCCSGLDIDVTGMQIAT